MFDRFRKSKSDSSGLSTAQLKALGQLQLPGWTGDVPASWIQVSGQQATLTLPFAAGDSILQPFREDPELGQLSWERKLKIEKLPNSQPELPLIYGNVIVVSSGKGGVGKSSVSVQLALALAEFGARVGILDADVYGPSLPTMLGGLEDKLQFNEQQKMIPHQRHGIAVSSLGYLTEAKDAAIWRGPMASAALQQLFRDTKWPALDYLIVDMPPGTGDIQLTFAQKLPITGVVVVTTPQTVALADAEKGISMFRKVGVPITGLIENMSFFECGQCGHREAIFGTEGGARVAAAEQVPLLGQWPLASRLRAGLDEGRPLLISDPTDPLCEIMRNSAQQLSMQLYQQAKNQV
ncbi:iron-sulfur cluster carrier protein ApbC [Pseudidiomarina salinarum]|uniref:iron-sulfur cluster carrier protein ApbC n=1 Tax=Pseudidiomarina salinarum TaxID=435908 RepID=UPI000553CE80|nr:iron-sulfur cluster carrier protein ApbC [Pseudidiomarina salinarum]RUO70291.1 iron-sulfur cluster carrier protein ApbC [Pseudidiomarina salinarum]